MHTGESKKRLPDYFLELSDDDPEPLDCDPLDEEPEPFDCGPPDDSLDDVFSGLVPPSDLVSLDEGLFDDLPRLSARESVR
jgi:hypothetical protein